MHNKERKNYIYQSQKNPCMLHCPCESSEGNITCAYMLLCTWKDLHSTRDRDQKCKMTRNAKICLSCYTKVCSIFFTPLCDIFLRIFRVFCLFYCLIYNYKSFSLDLNTSIQAWQTSLYLGISLHKRLKHAKRTSNFSQCFLLSSIPSF